MGKIIFKRCFKCGSEKVKLTQDGIGLSKVDCANCGERLGSVKVRWWHKEKK